MTPARYLVQEGALRHGERLAVVSDRGRASYADIDLRSDRFAGALAARGIKAADRIVVFMDDSVETVVAICGCLKAGAVLVPVDVRTDAADLAYVLDDCAAVAVITEARLGAVAATALRSSWSVKVVVLAGGDQRSVSDSCVAFEDAVGRGSRGSVPVAGEASHPLMLVYPRTAAGLAAPVTMTEADVLAARGREGRPLAAVVEGVRPVAGARGIAALVASLAAGATVVLSAARPVLSLRAAAA
jgi:acyl-CoA synthetase (AMP-forming)/AMP-acid ligase II